MTFAWPYILWLLVVPIAWPVWEFRRRHRAGRGSHPKILEAEAATHALTLAGPARAARRRAHLWLSAAVALGIVAVARPQWGHLDEPVFDQSREILLAIDLSRSMLTPDVKPSRLERAKLLVQSLLEKLAGERVGLVVFSGTAFLQSPLSSDYEILREFLPNLGPDTLPEGGTNYRALIDTALEAFGNSSAADRFLIVLSDGEATDDDWRPQVAELRKRGVRVLGLGVGTAAGAIIPDGTGGFVKDERGAVVLSKLEPATLQDLARETGGAYRDASSWVDLASLLQQTVEAGQKGKFVETKSIRYVERFQWPLAFSLACLLLSLCYEFPVRPKPRELRLTIPTPKETALSGLATLLVLALALPFSFTSQAKAAEPPPPPPAASVAFAALGKIVARLSSTSERSPRDWGELAQETVSWGQHLQSAQQPVPAGPVRDALQAVDLGSKRDPKTADWPTLRSELEKLLVDPEAKKNDQKSDSKQGDSKSDQDQKKSDSKSDDQKKQDQKNDKNAQNNKEDNKSPTPQPKDSNDGDKQQDKNSQDKSGTSQPKPGSDSNSAFGKMDSPPRPTPTPVGAPGETQKVGGATEKPPPDAAKADPALALPLQNLEQVRNDDSPARLFQLMEGEHKPKPKTGKDW